MPERNGPVKTAWKKNTGISALYILLIATVLIWCLSYDNGELRGHLISIVPWFLEITFFLVIIGFSLNTGIIKRAFEGISLHQWYLVIAVVLLGILMAAFVAPRVHRIFYDENIYLNIGQTIAAQKKAAMCAEGYNAYGEYRCVQLEHNKQPYAFPHLISIVFRLFGYGELPGFILNNLIFGLSIATIFLIGFLLLKSFSAGAYSALIFCLIPENIIWANTTAVEPAAALFSGLVVLTLLLYLREKKNVTLFLLSALLAYSLQFRPESLLIAPLIALILLLYDRNALKSQSTYLILAGALALIIPHIAQLYAVRGENWGSAGPRMSLAYFASNFETNALYYLNNDKFPILFTLLFAAGLFLYKNIKVKLVTISWFLLFWGVFLFFYAGSYEFGQDVRFSLLSYMPLSLLAGLGVTNLDQLCIQKELSKRFKIVALSVILVCFSGFMPYIRTIGEEACQARADHRYAMKMAEMLPDNAIVLTHNPNMFLLWGKNAAQAAIGSNNRPAMDHFFRKYNGGVYFHYNYWCNVDDPREKNFCENILKEYSHDPVIKYQESGYTFVLYRLKNK